MKYFFIYLPVLFLLASCSAVKNTGQSKAANTTVQPKQPGFIAGIEVTPEHTPATAKGQGNSSNPAFQTKNVAKYSSSLEMYTFTQFKYAIKLDVPVETLQNVNLYNTIDQWLGTRYRLGGTTQRGIDCSAFMQTIMLGVFAVQLPRTAREQFDVSSWVPMTNLKEGDLLFFNTIGYVSHVGMYLHNHKFVHSSSSGGVTISDLTDHYWSSKLICAGRVLQPSLPRP